MSETAQKPTIRFRGFTDPWEQRKLGEIYSPLIERNADLLPYNRTLSVATMTYKTDGNGAADSSLSNYKRLRVGDVAFEGHTSKEFRYGRFVLNDAGDGIMSPRFSALRPLAQMPINFWKYYIHYEPIMKKVLVNSTKAGTMMNELVVDEFLRNSIFVPSEKEQTRIGTVLANLDNLITLHQRKYEKLVDVKKALLEKMFPTDGENVPQIRFRGFTDPWEQRKFGNMFIERREKTIEENEDTLLSCAITGMYLNSELFGHFRGSTTIGYLKVKKNDLILSAQNLHLGNANVNLRFEKGIISPAYKVFDIYYGNPKFVQAWVKKEDTKDFFLSATTEGASQCRKNIEWDSLYRQTICVPNVKEQERIGSLLGNIDNLITLHQRKLEKLKNIKKALLDKMFV